MLVLVSVYANNLSLYLYSYINFRLCLDTEEKRLNKFWNTILGVVNRIYRLQFQSQRTLEMIARKVTTITNSRKWANLIKSVARIVRRRTKNIRQLCEELGSFDALCSYCPWTDGRVRHLPWKYCYLRYCDDAAETFYDEESRYFDNIKIK